MIKCTQCSTEIRATKKNIEALSHFQSRHPTFTFAACFPGAFDPTAAPVPSETSSSSSSAPVVAQAPKKKSTEDLSFLDSALDSKQFKKK